jgi:hypothetical protein
MRLPRCVLDVNSSPASGRAKPLVIWLGAFALEHRHDPIDVALGALHGLAIDRLRANPIRSQSIRSRVSTPSSNSEAVTASTIITDSATA